jgi:hypothetical protein
MLKETADEKAFAKRMMERSEADQSREIAANKRIIAQKRNRVDELDTLFERTYEDRVSGVLSEDRFTKMSTKYELEQKDLRTEITALEAAVNEREGQMGNVDKFLASAREIMDLKVLTPAIVNALIDKIVVYEPEGSRHSKDRCQHIEIHYRFVGPIDFMAEQEQA